MSTWNWHLCHGEHLSQQYFHHRASQCCALFHIVFNFRFTFNITEPFTKVLLKMFLLLSGQLHVTVVCRVLFGVWWLGWRSALLDLLGKARTHQYFVAKKYKTSDHQSSKTFIIYISAYYCFPLSSSSLSSSACLLNRSTTNMQVARCTVTSVCLTSNNRRKKLWLYE